MGIFDNCRINCDDSVDIRIKYKESSPILEQINKGNWIDLYTAEEVVLHAGDYKQIDLGVSMKMPEPYEAIIAPRSSTFKRYGLLETNSIGVIDTSYCGNDDVWQFPVYATRDITIPKGTRLCQFRIQERQPKIHFIMVDDLNAPSRGGFGSTGK